MLLTQALMAQSFTHQIIARNSGVDTLWDGSTIKIFGFANLLGSPIRIPGPVIEANEGDSVIIKFWNVSQGAPHTIHPHGLDVNQANDGVPHLSQSVGHMQQFYYRFKAPHAGTYLYHCHVASTIHVQAGMYGLVIIRPSSGNKNITWNGGYQFDSERSWLMSEVDTVWHNDTILNHPHDTTQLIHEILIPKYQPQYFLVNGYSEQELLNTQIQINANKGEKIYVRLANIGFYGNQIIFPTGLNAQIIDSDGRPLPAVSNNDTVWVFPGERYGVMLSPNVDMTDSIKINYVNMNTMQTENTQFIHANISGTFSVEENKLFNSFDISPNPSKGMVELKFELSMDYTYSLVLLDMSGRKIKDILISEMAYGNTEYKKPINLSGISSGVYLLHFITNDGVIQKKLVINN